MIEQSLKESEIIDREISRNFSTTQGYTTLNMRFACKGGGFINSEAILKGADYYLLMQRTQVKNDDAAAFFNSFSFKKLNYANAVTFADTLLQFKVQTAVAPVLDSALANIMYSMMHDESFLSQVQQNAYWPKNEYAIFKSDSTGEAILVSSYQFPNYYHAKRLSNVLGKTVER